MQWCWLFGLASFCFGFAVWWVLCLSCLLRLSSLFRSVSSSFSCVVSPFSRSCFCLPCASDRRLAGCMSLLLFVVLPFWFVCLSFVGVVVFVLAPPFLFVGTLFFGLTLNVAAALSALPY